MVERSDPGPERPTSQSGRSVERSEGGTSISLQKAPASPFHGVTSPVNEVQEVSLPKEQRTVVPSLMSYGLGSSPSNYFVTKDATCVQLFLKWVNRGRALPVMKNPSEAKRGRLAIEWFTAMMRPDEVALTRDANVEQGRVRVLATRLNDAVVARLVSGFTACNKPRPRTLKPQKDGSQPLILINSLDERNKELIKANSPVVVDNSAFLQFRDWYEQQEASRGSSAPSGGKRQKKKGSVQRKQGLRSD